MPSRSRSRERERSPQSKRPKIFRACAACVSSKTRCEDVTAAGCALCRRRSKACSLAAIASALEGTTGPSQPVPAPFSGIRSVNGAGLPSHSLLTSPASMVSPAMAEDDVRARLSEAERRLAATERALADLEGRVASGNSSTGRVHPTRAEEEEILIAGPLRLSALELGGHDETLWSVACTKAYPSPMTRGLLTPAEAELVWHGFKARVARLLPIPPFTAVSTPVPEHGFVMLAALHHVPALIRDQESLKRLVDESVVLAMASHASVDVVLALLILSLAPPLPDDGGETAPTNPTAWRMISLAKSMCVSMGLEGRALAALRRGAELNDEMWADNLWLLQLWCAVENRHAIMSLMYPQAPAPAPLSLRLPVLQREQLEAANVHLRAEADLVSAFTPFTAHLAAVEREGEWELDSLRELVSSWDRAKEAALEVVRANPQRPSLHIDARCVEFALSIRIALFLTWMPSPLKDAREMTLHCLRFFPRNMTAMLDIVAPPQHAPGENLDCGVAPTQTPQLPPPPIEPSLVPEWAVVMVASAAIAFRRAVRYVAIAYPKGKLIEGSRLDDAVATLATLGRAPRFIVTQGEKTLGNFQYSPKWSGAASPNWNGYDRGGPPHDVPAFELDIMSWDLSLLYPDLGLDPETWAGSTPVI